MSLYGVHNINNLKVHFPEQPTAGQVKVQTSIDAVNKDYFANYGKNSPKLSQKHLNGEFENSDYLTRGNLESVQRNYSNVFGRRYYADASAAAFETSATALIALPACLFSGSASKFANCVKYIVGGAVYGVIQGLFSLACDKSTKAKEAEEASKNQKGNAAVVVIDGQYDFVGKRVLKAMTEDGAKAEANALLQKYGVTIDDLKLTVSKSPVGPNYELDGDFVEVNNELYVYPKGSLAVASAAQIVPVINALLDRDEAGLVKVASQDWHPVDHGSFAATLGAKLFDLAKLFGRVQVAWPIHCVQGSKGADFLHGLHMDKVQRIFQKGLAKLVDSYSTVSDNANLNATQINEHLASKNVKRIYIVGIATDYCVKFSALALHNLGYEVNLVTDGCEGVGFPNPVADEIEGMRKAGIKIVQSKDLPATL